MSDRPIASNRVHRRLAALIADRVEEDPRLLDAAHIRLAGPLAGSARRARWQQLLDQGVEAVAAALRELDDDGMLSDMPFALPGLVDDATRRAIIEEEHRR